MKLWLLKSEPSEYSYDHLERQKKGVWDGVANNQALIHLRNMRKGDRAFMYHSGKEKLVVGILDIVSDPYPDPRKNDPRLVVVDVAPRGRLTSPVALSDIKRNAAFASFELVRFSRLSVMPVPPVLWEKILGMSR
jgi:predicted RNA-binding protein with PUA-like domain